MPANILANFRDLRLNNPANENFTPLLSMKASFLSLSVLAAAIFSISSTASASFLLAGWYDFDQGTTAPEAADVSGFGYSGVAIKQAASFGSGGSSDGYYGNSDIFASSGADGLARATTGSSVVRPMVFEITNVSNTSGSFALKTLFFDAARSGGGGGLTVSYRVGSNPAVTLGTTGPLSNANNTNYGDYSFSLVGAPVLAVGESIRFIFRAAANSDAFIDNVAIVAVPEPGSLLALGGILVSGLFLRSRRKLGKEDFLTA
jgi:hypothetical protein